MPVAWRIDKIIINVCQLCQAQIVTIFVATYNLVDYSYSISGINRYRYRIFRYRYRILESVNMNLGSAPADRIRG